MAARKFVRTVTWTKGGLLSAAPTSDTLLAGDLPDTAVSPGSYTLASITVDQQGRITAASNGSAGTGTVSSVSVVTANGVSGSVATSTTTPAITLTLGAITPSTVNGITLSGSGSLANSGTSSLTAFTGSGSSSGTNTGDQTSVSGNAGTATALQTGRAINGVTFDGTAAITITAAAGTLTGATLNSTVLASSLTSVGTLTGGATGAGFTIALTTSTVTGTLPAARLPSFGSGDVSFASGGGAGTIAAAAVTLAKMANMATASLIYRKTAGAGAPEVNTLATLKTDLGLTGTNSGDQTITLTGDVTGSGTGSFTATLAHVPAGLGLRGHIDGLILSNNAPGSGTLNYAAGSCRDDTDAYTLSLSAGTKVMGNTWASGSGSHGLDTGSIATSTWYHVWAISQAAGAGADILFSTSATAPTMPSTYTLKRRVGAIFTSAAGGGAITDFVQNGDEFRWLAPVQDVAASNPGTAAVTRTLTAATGLKVGAIITVAGYDNGSAGAGPGVIYISDLATNDVAPTAGTAASLGSGSGATLYAAGTATVTTNTSAQVRSRCQLSGANTRLYLVTLGWIDPRGKNG